MSSLNRLLRGAVPQTLVLFAVSLSTPCQSNSTGAAEERFLGEPFQATPEQLRAASTKVPVDPQFEAQILLEEGTYRYAEDGTRLYQYRTIFRIDAASGLQHWAENSMEWDPWFEKPSVLKARVLQANGQFVELDQKTVTDAPVKVEESETFSSSHVRRAPLPGLAVGAIVEETASVEEKTPYFAAGGVQRFLFYNNVPSARIRLIVDLPSARPYRYRVEGMPSISVEKSDTAGRRRTVYEQTNIAAWHDSDIDLNTNKPEIPLVMFSTGASWKDIAANYAALADPQTVPADTQSILPNVSGSRSDVIAAVVARLHKEVRYTGVEFGEAKLTPQRPVDVIRRHFGDCKDKATLLVAMLRAKNIPASLALLDAGPGLDVDPQLPGMNRFDHAIVYVPEAGSDPAVWIDATAEFFQPGMLPYQDQGREALIIAPETTGLTLTPVAKPEDSVLIETRTFTLSSFGPSQVMESSKTSGSTDANYRSNYGGEDTAKVKETLTNYVQSAYLAKSLASITHGPTNDLQKPFDLTLVAEKASRGITTLNEAEVVIFPNMVLNSLPKWFQNKAPELGQNATEEAKHEAELAKAHRASSYSFMPFVDERRVRVAIPEGFSLRALPPAKTTKIGLGALTESYSIDEPGFVTAVYHFDSGTGTLTTEQALAMRADATKLEEREYVGIFFDQAGSKAIQQGKIREGLTADRQVIAAHPKDALAHVRLARALLEAGIGDQARAEGKRATELDSKLPIAWASYGWILEHDSLGVRFGVGFDLHGAVDAYKKAVALDPDNKDMGFDLAILYEFDVRGIRYAADADMPDAVVQYQKLIERHKAQYPSDAAQYRENLAYVFFFSNRLKELDDLLTTLPASTGHAALAVASTTRQSGVAKGVARADEANLGAAERSKTLIAAGGLLAQARAYSEASQVLQAGVGGGNDAATAARQIELYKNLQPASFAPLAKTDPAAPAQNMVLGLMAGTLTRDMVATDLAHHAYASDSDFERNADKSMRTNGFMRSIASKSGMSEVTLVDIIAGNMKFQSSGSDTDGYVVVENTPGSAPQSFFVVREDGSYRIVADGSDNFEVGNEALYLLKQGNTKSAQKLLDWKRELTHRGSQDDLFAGPLLPRFWTTGSSKPDANSPAAMRLAAISLLSGSMDAKAYLAEVAAARESATGPRQADLDLLLASAANGAEQPATALPAAKRLLVQEPDSLTALRLVARAYELQNDSGSRKALMVEKRKNKPSDHDLAIEEARADEAAKDYTAARGAFKSAMESEKTNAADYNGFAWMGLFDQHEGEAELKAAQQSNMLSKNASFGDLHTLACVYATQGHTTEAREVLAQAMVAGNMSAPNSDIWLALGMLYEQYGEIDAAKSAYEKVQAHEFDNHTYIEAESSYVLAQMRLKTLVAK